VKSLKVLDVSEKHFASIYKVGELPLRWFLHVTPEWVVTSSGLYVVQTNLLYDGRSVSLSVRLGVHSHLWVETEF
jgi:hypothetical protein